MWMIGSLALIWVFWVLAFRLYPSQTDNQVVGGIFFALTGILLGIGRQGVDLMGVRAFVASMGVLAAVPAHYTGLGDCITANFLRSSLTLRGHRPYR
jgi:hypothetical protein